MFSWNKNYSVGIEEIDNQHKKLICLFNDVFKYNNSSENKSDIEKVCDKFLEFANWHFASELSYMKNLSYSIIDEHNAEHKVIINKLYELKSDISKYDNDDWLSELVIILKNWFINHFTLSDQKLFRFLKENGFTDYKKM